MYLFVGSIYFASFYGFVIWLWSCSDSVVFFFIFYYQLSLVTSHPAQARCTWYNNEHYVIVCQWLASGRRFSLGLPVSSTNKTGHHDITEILLKVALNTIIPNPIISYLLIFSCIIGVILLDHFAHTGILGVVLWVPIITAVQFLSQDAFPDLYNVLRISFSTISG